jgi:hypothetical protein
VLTPPHPKKLTKTAKIIPRLKPPRDYMNKRQTSQKLQPACDFVLFLWNAVIQWSPYA